MSFCCSLILKQKKEGAHDDTVLANLDMVSYSCSFDNCICANMNMISNLHGIVIEVAAVGLVGWPRR